MSNGYIAIIDSGIGGISVLGDLIKKLPNQKYLYLGDEKNAPYGNKSIEELYNITCKNIDLIKTYNVKAIVLGCNTLSTNLYNEIIRYASIPVFGVFPPVNATKKIKGNTLLLATKRTAERYLNSDDLVVVGLENLASEIEKNLNDFSKVSFLEIDEILNRKFPSGFRGVFDNVILGCTHYNFVKNKIINHFCPQRVFSGNDYVVSNVFNFVCNEKSLVKYKRFEILFLTNEKKYYDVLNNYIKIYGKNF